MTDSTLIRLSPKSIRTIQGLRKDAGFSIRQLAGLYRVPESVIEAYCVEQNREIARRGGSGNRILPPAEVVKKYATGLYTYSSLGREYGVTKAAVFRVVDKFAPHLKKGSPAPKQKA